MSARAKLDRGLTKDSCDGRDLGLNFHQPDRKKIFRTETSYMQGKGNNLSNHDVSIEI